MKKIALLLLLLSEINSAKAQTATVGLIQNDSANYPGYILFAPVANTKTYLIDKCGFNIHSWSSTYKAGLACYLTDDGSLVRAGNTANPAFPGGGDGGIVEKYDWNGNLIWSYTISSTSLLQHHDIKPMPNGNVLVVAWEKKTPQQAIAMGRNPANIGLYVWNERVMELQPTGLTTANIVWEWSLWDHLNQDYDSLKLSYDTIANHPELIDINYYYSNPSAADWVHVNAIDYNADLDQIIISSRIFSEFWIIDHSTTTAEAALHTGGNCGKGGDILYRWGNPQTYHRGTTSDKMLYGQHDVHWIKSNRTGEGNIMVFNNGQDRPQGNYSSVEILSPPIDISGNYATPTTLSYQPDSTYWKYIAPVPTDFFSNNISGADRLLNGNTIICDGNSGIFFEVDTTKQKIWEYINPVNATGPVAQGTAIATNAVFKPVFYETNFAGFNGKTLSSSGPIELNPVTYSYSCSVSGLANQSALSNGFSVYPNPSRGIFTISSAKATSIIITDLLGKIILNTRINPQTNLQMQLNYLEKGMYLIKSEEQIQKIIIQ